jgi:hypothetical protein
MSSDRTRRSLSHSSRSSHGSSAKQPATSDDPGQKLVESSPTVVATSSVSTVSDGIRKITLSPPRGRGPHAHGVIVVGPAG